MIAPRTMKPPFEYRCLVPGANSRGLSAKRGRKSLVNGDRCKSLVDRADIESGHQIIPYLTLPVRISAGHLDERFAQPGHLNDSGELVCS
jgi:hypothetical protein